MTPGERLREYQRLLDRADLLTTAGVHLALASVLFAFTGMGALVAQADRLASAAGATTGVAFLAGAVVSRASARALERVREARRQLG